MISDEKQAFLRKDIVVLKMQSPAIDAQQDIKYDLF